VDLWFARRLVGRARSNADAGTRAESDPAGTNAAAGIRACTRTGACADDRTR